MTGWQFLGIAMFVLMAFAGLRSVARIDGWGVALGVAAFSLGTTALIVLSVLLATGVIP